MIVAEDPEHADGVGRQPALLLRFAQRGGHGRLVAVLGAARRPPGAAVITPPAPALQQHTRLGAAVSSAWGVGQQPRRAVPAPVPVAVTAGSPAVPIPIRHRARP